jgi:hypothetical protein
VREEIVALLREERGQAGANAAAEAAMAKLTAGEKLETLAASLNAKTEPPRFVSRADPSIPAALRTAIFDAPRPAATPVVQTTTLDNGATALFVVTRTRTADTSANPMLAQQQTQTLRERIAAGDIAAYINEAKRNAKISKNPGVFEQ